MRFSSLFLQSWVMYYFKVIRYLNNSKNKYILKSSRAVLIRAPECHSYSIFLAAKQSAPWQSPLSVCRWWDQSPFEREDLMSCYLSQRTTSYSATFCSAMCQDIYYWNLAYLGKHLFTDQI